MSAAELHRHFYDRDGIFVALRWIVWDRHILAVHAEMEGNESAIHQALRWPEQINQDKEHPDRLVYYAQGVLKGIEPDAILKVVVQYVQNEWGDRAGEVITAFAVNTISRREQRLWPEETPSPTPMS